MAANWLEDFAGNRLSVFLTVCFAAIGAVNVVLEIARSLVRFHRATWGRTKIVCLRRDDGDPGDAPRVVCLWRLTNRGPDPITIVAQAVQIRGMRRSYREAGDHAVREVLPNSFGAIVSRTLGPHYVLRDDERETILPWQDCRTYCMEEMLRLIVGKENLHMPVFFRVAFITTEDKTICGPWQRLTCACR